VLLLVLLGSAPSGSARPNLRLTVQLAPGSISPGEHALAGVEFANTGPATLTHVVVTLRFPTILAALSASGCTPVHGSLETLVCTFGNLAPGRTASKLVVTRIVGQVTHERHVTVDFSLRVGSNGAPPILADASALLLGSRNAASEGSCKKVPTTLSASLEQQSTVLPSPPSAAGSLHLPCTPLSVGVDPKLRPGSPGIPPGEFRTPVATVELPLLKRPATVVLRFPDEMLPDERLVDNRAPGSALRLTNPDPLWKSALAAPGPWTIVPRCKTGPTLPVGWQSCIASVHSTDPDGDDDAGTITLLVRGAGFGDPRYVG
jgi:hypothetical protein